MTREIKFRRWNIHLEDMIYSKIDEPLSTFFEIIETYPTHYQLMQFTGLTDKNGQAIYEGDICECEVDSQTFGFLKLKGTMKWWDEEARFSIQFASEIDFENRIVKSVEVIGNIYENENLLS